jgi:hyperpolarization activated cyclic nucleotide-gated potassium channel 1
MPFFKNFNQLLKNQILLRMRPMKLKQGEIVYKRGEHPILIYFILTGRINFVYGEHDTTFKTFVAGSYFGELELLRNVNRLFTTRCQVDTSFLVITGNAFIEVLKDHPAEWEEFSHISH